MNGEEYWMIGANSRLVVLICIVGVVVHVTGCASGAGTLEVDNERTGTSDAEWKKVEPVQIDDSGEESIDVECPHGIDEMRMDIGEAGEEVVVNYKCANDRYRGGSS